MQNIDQRAVPHRDIVVQQGPLVVFGEDVLVVVVVPHLLGSGDMRQVLHLRKQDAHYYRGHLGDAQGVKGGEPEALGKQEILELLLDHLALGLHLFRALGVDIRH
jgi:hypothetical protein